MRFTALKGAIILCLALSAPGQEPPLPKPDSQDSAPNATRAPDLIPADVLSPADRAAVPAPLPPNVATIPQLDESFKQNPLSATAENARRHAEWRELQNRVVNDREVKAALRRADAAPTDLIKRKLLRDYYEIFFGRMIALASSPETTAYLNERKKEQLNALPQPRVRPEPSATPKP